MNISANYTALPLAGTMDEGLLGDGVTGTSVHRIYCVAAGNVTVTAKGGGTFTWTGAQNDYLDIVAKTIVVNAGTFVGFKARYFSS